jgi:DNA-directed RNA polymerase specialized sigma subunit
MYLMLHTQGVEVEIGTKYAELCLHPTGEVGDIIQTDLRLKKGVDAWKEKHDVQIQWAFNWNTALGVCESLATKLAMNKVHQMKDDLYSAGLEGIAKAYMAEGVDQYGRWGYTVQSIRNAIIDQKRKAERWNNEIGMSRTDPRSQFPEYGNPGTAGYHDEMEPEETIVSALWQEAPPSAEEQVLRKEEIEAAYRRVVPLLKDFKDRERYVLFKHILADEPMTIRQMALEHKVGKSSIQRDINRVRGRLRI